MEGKHPVLFITCLLAGMAGCLGQGEAETKEPQFPSPPDAEPLAHLVALRASPELRFETDHGTIRMLLYTEHMPTTAGRIGELASSGYYDETIIHRVVDDFVIQGGDASKTGLLGSGQTIPHEVHPDLLFGAGAVGLARDIDPDSGDSQWFITEKPAPHLSDPARSRTGEAFGAFALYAQVFEGREVVQKIAAVPVVPGADRPIKDVHLREATLLDPPRIDLLQLPPTIFMHDAATIQRPLHLYAGHPFEVTVFLPPQDDASPPTELPIDYHDKDNRSAAPTRVVLHPLESDPWVFKGTLRLDAGEWKETLPTLSTRSASMAVHPWHPEYARFTGSP